MHVRGVRTARRYVLALGIVAAAAAAGANAVSEKPTKEYAGAMQTLDTAARGLAEALEARDHATMNEHVIDARPAIEVVQSYWRERDAAGADDVEAAVDAIAAVSKSVSEISVAVHLMTLSPNPVAVDGAELALGNMRAACAACHAAYRVEQPDGSYLIR